MYMYMYMYMCELQSKFMDSRTILRMGIGVGITTGSVSCWPTRNIDSSSRIYINIYNHITIRVATIAIILRMAEPRRT